MAITPNSNDAFFREVDEEVRRDRLTGLWARWGRVALVGVGVLLVVLALALWWRSHRDAQAARAGEELTAVLADAPNSRARADDPRLAALAQASRPGYRALAALTAADLQAATDPKGAAARFQALADDAHAAQPIRDLALLRAATLRFDTLPPAAVVAMLRPLAQPGGPWFGSAAELTAMAYLKMNRRDLAASLFAAIARDGQAPGSLRGRAATMAAALGIQVDPAPAGAAKE